MRSMFLYLAGSILIVATWGIALLWLWAMHRQWWNIPTVRRHAWKPPLVGVGFVALWLAGDAAGWSWLAEIASLITIIFFVVGTALMLSLPFSGIVLLVERLVRWIAHGRSSDQMTGSTSSTATVIDDPPQGSNGSATVAALPLSDPGRRSFIVKAAAAIPGLTVIAAGYGVADSFSDASIPIIPMYYPQLPTALEGVRILHLSDIHIGPFVSLNDLERCLIRAERQRPDIVLVSGDVADELEHLPDALRLIAALKPRLGVYASLGNHEYYRGIDTVVRHFDAGPIPLLRENGTVVEVGTGRLFIGGTDDPARGGSERDRPLFLRRTVDATLDGAPSNAFHLLMSHRPEGWDTAADAGIELTVAGHYHGGVQMGWRGRGVIEPLTPNNYIWGHYRRGDSHLYTSAGLGHWLPFRLGCPREAPIYVLTGRQA